MSGHSKWSTIKRKKGAADDKRGRIFTKIGREIAVAVRDGGAEPTSNSKLRDAIAKAKANNMPGDSITRSIKKAAGESGGNSYEEIVYEGYGPSGTAFIVEALTDNRNRTAGDVRHLFDKFGGNLGQSGCVMFLFDRMGVLLIEKDENADEDTVMDDALTGGASDFDTAEDSFTVLTEAADFSKVLEYLENKGYSFETAEIQYMPKVTVELTDEDHIKKMNILIDKLEELDDVQSVFHNGIF